MLQSLDTHWREHLAPGPSAPGHPSARLRAEDPKQEYKREAFELFETCSTMRNDVTQLLVTVQIRSPEDVEETAPHAGKICRMSSITTPISTRRWALARPMPTPESSRPGWPEGWS